MQLCNKYTVLLLRFLPMVLEAVLDAARQKTHAVPYQNHSPLNIGYSFYFFDGFNTPQIIHIIFHDIDNFYQLQFLTICMQVLNSVFTHILQRFKVMLQNFAHAWKFHLIQKKFLMRFVRSSNLLLC